MTYASDRLVVCVLLVAPVTPGFLGALSATATVCPQRDAPGGVIGLGPETKSVRR